MERAQPQRHPDADGHGKRGPNGAANTTANGQLDDAPLPNWRLIIGIRLTQCHEGRQVQETSRRGSAQVHGSSGGCVGCVLTLYWSRQPANVSRAGFGRDAMQIPPAPSRCRQSRCHCPRAVGCREYLLARASEVFEFEVGL